ncbi:MAG: response regulator [Treponema sp.]|nr:response regulator [Treponema sp.]
MKDGKKQKNNISVRFKTINMLLFAVIIIFIAAVSAGMFVNVSAPLYLRIIIPGAAVVLSFFIYAAASSVLIKKMMLSPLQSLIKSVSSATLMNNEITGVDRDDEIGELARTMLKTWKRFNKNNETLMSAMNDRDHRDQLLHTINIVAAILLDSDIPQFERSLYRCMGMMAATVDADRVYIWENSINRGQLCATQIYEWSERVEPQQGKEHTINISYSEKLPKWGELLSRGQCINSLVRDMPDTLQIFSYSKAMSVFLAPVFLQETFWGFIGFDNCHREVVFSENEAAILRSGCLMIASAFQRHNNITEIVKLQTNLEDALKEAQIASHAKSTFLAQMSHEIRTPMNSIVGFSELAMDGDISMRTKDYLSKIIENAQWLLQIINDILDLSKIESGRMDLEKIPFDLCELFSGCKTLIMPKAVEKGINLVFYAEPSMGKKPLGDPTRLRQVLVNLLSNAVKFTNTGAVKVFADIRDKTDTTVTMYFEVKDSGIGMTEEQIAKIFDPFTQAESGTTRQYGGTGLGLSITKNILELMGGVLSVESKIGTGSRFSFVLTFDTITLTDKEQIKKEVSHSYIDKPVFSGEVLLCEDNVMNQQVICEHLKRIGLKTVVAENGKIGVDFVQSRLEKKQFDLVLMDIHMPVMDGLEAASRILEFDKNIPVVALTANIMTSDKDIYMANGIIDCIGKPFTSQELWRCLLKYLKPLETGKLSPDAAQKTADVDSDEEFHKKLQLMFIRSNHNKFSEIVTAMKNDLSLAYRLTHSLKSNAGQIGMRKLQSAAAVVERQLKGGVNRVTEEELLHLETELSAVLNELSHLMDEQSGLKEMDDLFHAATAPSVSKPDPEESGQDYAEKILNTLEPLLKMGSPDCCKLIDSIRAISGDAHIGQIKDTLVQQIDDFEFDQAFSSYKKLKEALTGVELKTN